jgi:hypothetical protein
MVSFLHFLNLTYLLVKKGKGGNLKKEGNLKKRGNLRKRGMSNITRNLAFGTFYL